MLGWLKRSKPALESPPAQPEPPALQALDHTVVLQHVNDALVLVSASHRVVWLNRLARHLFGTADDPTGRSLIEVLRDYRLDELVGRALTVNEEQGAELSSFRNRRVLRTRAIPNPEGGVWLIVEDLTRLRQLETVRQDFVGNLSHELRTPVAGLHLAAETLSSVLDPADEAGQFLERIKAEAERLDLMVRNLTQLAALDAQEVQFAAAPFSARRLVEEMGERFTPRAEAKGLVLSIETEAAPLEALGDRGKLEQACGNIVENALKFTSRGSVKIAAYRESRWVAIRVSDTGPGIPADDLPRIFERFYKVDRARGTAGSGLGLSIARHLVELQGGSIKAESEPGRGTAMTVLLPAAEASQP